MTPALQRALQLHQNGDPEAALPLYVEALAAEPDAPAALFYGGAAARSAGQYDLAAERLDHLLRLLPQPAPDVLYQRALVHREQGQPDAALGLLQRALQLRPDWPPALNDYGNLLRQAHQHEAAETALRRAQQLAPQDPDILCNRGLNALQGGALDAAKGLLQEGLRRHPDHAELRATLIETLLDRGEQGEALRLAQASVKRLPQSPLLWNALGQAEQDSGHIDAALAAYRQGATLAPDAPQLILNLAQLENENAHFDAALARYQQLGAHHAGARLRAATLLPSIPASEAAIDDARARFRRELAALREAGTLRLDDPPNEYGDTPFYLSYHGREDDAQLLGELAQTLRAACPTLAWRAPHLDQPPRAHGGKPRIGFCSHFLFDQSVGRALHAFITALPRDEFDVHLFLIPPFFDDPLAQRLRADTHTHYLPQDLHSARQQIAAQALDLLIYPEIGMDALTYYLAHARLAPQQWTTLGHPCSSGLDSIDVYFSHDRLEPPGNERFYSERLLRLGPGSPYPAYPGPSLPERPRDRAALGLPTDGELLICPQSLFKLMPQFDSALAHILDARPQARLLLPDARMPGLTAALKARLARSLGPASERILYFPWRARSAFSELIGACDLLLDPYPVGGGITTWDALLTGTPIVTAPGPQMRSRFAACALQLAGLDGETVAAPSPEAYAQHAIALLDNPERRAALRQHLQRAAPDVLAERSAVPAFIEAVRQAVAV